MPHVLNISRCMERNPTARFCEPFYPRIASFDTKHACGIISCPPTCPITNIFSIKSPTQNCTGDCQLYRPRATKVGKQGPLASSHEVRILGCLIPKEPTRFFFIPTAGRCLVLLLGSRPRPVCRWRALPDTDKGKGKQKRNNFLLLLALVVVFIAFI